MKKLLSAVLALTMLLLTACGGSGNSGNFVNTGSPESPADTPVAETPAVIDSIYTDVTGIPGEKVLVTVDGNEVPAAMYFCLSVGNAQNLISQLLTNAMYYGMYADAFGADGALNWDYELSPGITLRFYLEQQCRSAAQYYATVENMAKEAGISLTDEDRAALASTAASIAEQYRAKLVKKDPSAADLSAEEIMAKYLKMIGINSALQDRLGANSYLYNELLALVLTPGSSLYLEDADCNEYGYYADHILISTVDTATRQPLSEEEVIQKTALAEDIVAQIEGSDDPIALFESLADQYSEDPGRETNPTGYIFTPGTMVAEFESATEALGYGEISGIVKSDYGYHIILRRDIAEGLALYPEEKTQFAEEYLGDLLNLKMFDSETVFDEALTGFDYAKFYEDYNAMVTSIAEPETATE